MKKQIPNILTSIRIAMIPLIVYSFYTISKIPNVIVWFLFSIAGFTDFFDGYYARKLQVQSNFGKCFDPIADKALVIVSLVMIINFSNENLYILVPSLIIITREILVSGLREFLADKNVKVPVSRIGKWKTGIQMISIGALLLAGDGSEFVYNEIMSFMEVDDFIRMSLEGWIQLIGEIGLIIASFLSLLSCFYYLRESIKNF
ncbi:MAG: CDP-diacylglycerol--glycerol-3-phosphate 3-phosphatidyltransferase [Rickettsiales bacterium]|jgi:CDP-diacylglycerol--glycerol-3-phosphate 3-phosphatidyltransferase|nr:CDP-diacylglycerol--glycerol-3-phosphate 3-phosphatidyltransferase [Rickettsiales bacterium]